MKVLFNQDNFYFQRNYLRKIITESNNRKKEFLKNLKKYIRIFKIRIHLTMKKLFLRLFLTNWDTVLSLSALIFNVNSLSCLIYIPNIFSNSRKTTHFPPTFRKSGQIHRLRQNVKRLCKSLWLLITQFLFVACLHSVAGFWATEILLQCYERIVWKMRSVALSHVSHSRSLGDDKVTHGSKIPVGCFTTSRFTRDLWSFTFF